MGVEILNGSLNVIVQNTKLDVDVKNVPSVTISNTPGVSVINTPGVAITSPISEVTGNLQVIQTEHDNIHKGYGYSIYVLKEALADNAKYTFSLQTCAATSGYIHFQYYAVWTNNAKVIVRMYQGPTTAPTGGTAVTPRNRNRTDGLTACSAVKEGVTFDSTGAIQIDLDIFGGGGTIPTARQGGSGDNKGIEWILKPSTYYCWEFENKSGAAADVIFKAFWYEEEKGGL